MVATRSIPGKTVWAYCTQHLGEFKKLAMACKSKRYGKLVLKISIAANAIYRLTKNAQFATIGA
jgi:hypothetical protein